MAFSIDERRHRFTFDEYLRLAEASDARLEYWAGLILDMAGGAPRHSRICMNIARVLGTQLRGRPCQPYDSNLRLRAVAANRATYADVVVVSGDLELDPEDRSRQTVLNPAVVFEVASPTTERDDRGAKRDAYKTIASIQAVVLVSQDRPEILLHSRQPDGSWRQASFETGEVELAKIGCKLPVEEVYADLPES